MGLRQGRHASSGGAASARRTRLLTAAAALAAGLASVLLPATSFSAPPDLPAAHATLVEIQARLDALTPPAARLYGLFVATRHDVQAARVGTHPTRALLHRFTRAVEQRRVPRTDDPRRRALAQAMFAHEVAKEALARQNAFIEDAIHRAGHVVSPTVAALRSSGRMAEWAASVWEPSSTPGEPLAVCPVAGPHSFIDTFGAPRPGGRRHEGNDILAAQWTPILAPADGTVQRYPNELGGNALLEYTPTARMYFAHLVAYGHAGAVTAGTVIGYVGNTGNARGLPYHLHFQYEPGGDAVDPYPYLRAVC